MDGESPMSQKSLGLSPELYHYLLKVSPPEPSLLKALREETQKLPEGNMQITSEQGQFMALIAQLMGARKLLEIGVFTGYSSLAVMQSLPEDARLTALDISDSWTSVAKSYWQRAGLDHRIDLRVGPAMDALIEMLDQGQTGSFDFVFIDADKERYRDYYECALSLLRPGGLILIDNLLWGGKVVNEAVSDADTQAIRNFNRFIAGDVRVDYTLLPIADGLGFALKKSGLKA
jgi:predicted O-methyltransferase YrrM